MKLHTLYLLSRLGCNHTLLLHDRLYFLHWVLLMSALACALVLAASREDPRVYDQPLDVFRGCCEGLSILLLTLAVVSEVYNVFL